MTGGGTETSADGAGGERASITGADGTVTRFVYGIDGELLAEYRGSFAATAPEVEYGYRGGEQLITARADETRWHVRDNLGTARIALDQTGSLANGRRNDHLPFGEELTGGVAGRTAPRGYAPTNERNRFTGHARDRDTGYGHTLWRKLDSVQGRWTSPDPYGGSMEIGNPQSFNRYAYVLNDPVNASDPLGLFQAAPKADYSGLWSLWLGRQELLEVALQPVGEGGGGGQDPYTLIEEQAEMDAEERHTACKKKYLDGTGVRAPNETAAAIILAVAQTEGVSPTLWGFTWGMESNFSFNPPPNLNGRPPGEDPDIGPFQINRNTWKPSSLPNGLGDVWGGNENTALPFNGDVTSNVRLGARILKHYGDGREAAGRYRTGNGSFSKKPKGRKEFELRAGLYDAAKAHYDKYFQCLRTGQ